RRVDDYLVKPASPRQVLSVGTRLLERSQLRQQRVAEDFANRFSARQRARDDARDWRHYFELYDELTEWELRLHDAGERGLLDTVDAFAADVRLDFGNYVTREYAGWTSGRIDDRPPLSVDVVKQWVAPE